MVFVKRFLSPVSFLLVFALLLSSCSGSETVVEGNGPPPTNTPVVVPTAPTATEPSIEPTEEPTSELSDEAIEAVETDEPAPTEIPVEPTAEPDDQEDNPVEPEPVEVVDEPEPEPEPLIFRNEDVAPPIDELVAAYDGVFGIVLATGDGTVFYESLPDESMEAASIYKLAVMVEVYRQINDGRFALDDGVLIVDGFLVEGPDNLGWDAVGSYYSVETLLYLMITLSSNVASYALLDLVGSANVNYTMNYYGLHGIEIRWSPLVQRPVLYPPEPEEVPAEEEPAPEEEPVPDEDPATEEEPEEELEQFEEEPVDGLEEVAPPEDEQPVEDAEPGFPAPIIPAPMSSTAQLQGFSTPLTMRADISYNVVTARAVAQLLLLILNGQAVSEDASRMMMDLLSNQHIFGGLSLGVPDGALAHKTGYLPDGVVNDAGIISTPSGPVIAVVLTEHVREDLVYEVMSRVGQVVWDVGVAGTNNSP